MELIINTFTTREIAVFIWLIVLIVWAMSSKTVRSSVFDLLKVFVDLKIIVPLASMVVYVLLIVFLLAKAGFWDNSMIKDTAYWVIGGAFVIMINAARAIEDRSYFKSILLENLRLVLIIEFIVNLHNFSIAIELILVPVVTFLIMLATVAASNKEYAQVKKVLEYIIGAIGLILIVYASYAVLVDLRAFATMANLRNILLTPILSAAFLPFMYLVVLWMIYENVFVRIDFLNQDRALVGFAKRKLFTTFWFSLKKVKAWSKQMGMMHIEDKGDFLKKIQEFMESSNYS
jgi:hypothetical protein